MTINFVEVDGRFDLDPDCRVPRPTPIAFADKFYVTLDVVDCRGRPVKQAASSSDRAKPHFSEVALKSVIGPRHRTNTAAVRANLYIDTLLRNPVRTGRIRHACTFVLPQVRVQTQMRNKCLGPQGRRAKNRFSARSLRRRPKRHQAVGDCAGQMRRMLDYDPRLGNTARPHATFRSPDQPPSARNPTGKKATLRPASGGRRAVPDADH